MRGLEFEAVRSGRRTDALTCGKHSLSVALQQKVSKDFDSILFHLPFEREGSTQSRVREREHQHFWRKGTATGPLRSADLQNTENYDYYYLILPFWSMPDPCVQGSCVLCWTSSYGLLVSPCWALCEGGSMLGNESYETPAQWPCVWLCYSPNEFYTNTHRHIHTQEQTHAGTNTHRHTKTHTGTNTIQTQSIKNERGLRNGTYNQITLNWLLNVNRCPKCFSYAGSPENWDIGPLKKCIIHIYSRKWNKKNDPNIFWVMGEWKGAVLNKSLALSEKGMSHIPPKVWLVYTQM